MADFREVLMIINDGNNNIPETYNWSIEKEDLNDGESTTLNWGYGITLGQAVDKLVDFLPDNSKILAATTALLNIGSTAVSEEY